MTCLTCHRVANAYDPYLSVCLPIVKEETLDFHFVPALSHRAIVTTSEDRESTQVQSNEENGENGPEVDEEEQKVSYELHALSTVEVTVSKSMRVADVKTAMISKMDLRDVSPNELVVCN